MTEQEKSCGTYPDTWVGSRTVTLIFQFLVSDKHSTKRSFVIVVDLQADANLGLGMTVSALDDGDIVVQSMMRNGPAERDGRLRIGDHINSIDGRSLEGSTEADADQLIRQLHGHVRIVALRPVSSPYLHPDRDSDYFRDQSRNTGSLNGGRGESSSRRILKRPSMSNRNPDTDGVSSPEMHVSSARKMSISTSQLTATEDDNDPAGTTGL